MTILPPPPTAAPTSLFARPERLPIGLGNDRFCPRIETGRKVRQHQPALDPPSVCDYRKGDPW